MKPNLNWNRKCNQSISKDLQKNKERKGNRWTLHFYNSSHNDQNYSYCLNHILYSDICLDICPLSRTGSPCRVCLNSELFNSFTFSQFWEKYLDIQVSLKFSHSVQSNSWQPHDLQHTRLPGPPSNPGACSNSCPLSPWCHPTISSSFNPFCLKSFPASGSFPMSQIFASSGKVLELQLQHESLQWIFRTDFL